MTKSIIWGYIAPIEVQSGSFQKANLEQLVVIL